MNDPIRPYSLPARIHAEAASGAEREEMKPLEKLLRERDDLRDELKEVSRKIALARKAEKPQKQPKRPKHWQNKERYRAAMNLRAEGRSYADVGAQLGVGAVRARDMVHQARSMAKRGTL